MQWSASLVVRVFACCTFFSIYVTSEDSESQREKLHQFVKTMLGFKESPNMPHPKNPAEEAPKYMLDLYERFKDGPISKGQLSGNTVRSIKAKIETVSGQPMFIFNLTSLVSTEEMISAEIHLFKRRKTHFNKNGHLELILHEIAPNYVTESGKITLRAESYGWQWFDVTNSVQSCLAERRDKPNALGLNFKMIIPEGKFHVWQLKRFMHHHSVPYLVIYSNDSDDLDLDSLEKARKDIKLTGKHIESEIDSKTDTGISERTKARGKRSVSDNSADLPALYPIARSRSILTNEIPEDPNDYQSYPVGIGIQTHPGMLQTRKESRHRLTDPNQIPYPQDYLEQKKLQKWRNRRRKGKRGRKKNTLELPKEWEKLQNQAIEDHSETYCGKRKLIVDFNDIGWGEWIISPKSFKAHYCSGSCPFPLTKKLRPSNHATIQSLVNAIGINPDVPAPCCVPDKLSSVTLLYLDENRNVVLKNYPNMTVKKCACR